MTSVRKLYANRRNARLSTGPKTPLGKARSAQNARRHGLAVSVRRDPTLRRMVEALARTIGGAAADADCRAQAERIATAQMELMRVRRARQALVADAFETGDVLELARLDRYERDARARRKFAIRGLDRARQEYDRTIAFFQNEATGRKPNDSNVGKARGPGERSISRAAHRPRMSTP